MYTGLANYGANTGFYQNNYSPFQVPAQADVFNSQPLGISLNLSLPTNFLENFSNNNSQFQQPSYPGFYGAPNQLGFTMPDDVARSTGVPGERVFQMQHVSDFAGLPDYDGAPILKPQTREFSLQPNYYQPVRSNYNYNYEQPQQKDIFKLNKGWDVPKNFMPEFNPIKDLYKADYNPDVEAPLFLVPPEEIQPAQVNVQFGNNGNNNPLAGILGAITAMLGQAVQPQMNQGQPMGFEQEVLELNRPQQVSAQMQPQAAGMGNTGSITGPNSGNSPNNTMNLLSDVINLLSNILALNPQNMAPQQPVQPQWSNENVENNSWGDPHFALIRDGVKTQAFDFQGRNDTSYKMLDNDNFALNAKFSDSKNLDARIITDQNLTLKGSDVNIVTHRNGAFDIYHKGEKIGDQSNYEEIAKDPRMAGIDLNLDDKLLKVNYKGREIKQSLGATVDNLTNVNSRDNGLLTQLAGALDNDENKLDGVSKVDLNKDGKITEDETLHYNAANQALVSSSVAAISAPVKLEGDDSNDLAVNLLDSISNPSKAKYLSTVFDGAFEGAKEIKSSSDEKLKITDKDSEGVILAKKALKSAYSFTESDSKTAKEKEAAASVIANWVDVSTQKIKEDTIAAKGSVANGFKENDGYSKSQWNELIASTKYTTKDELLT